MSVRTNLLLPEQLVREVDRVAGPRGRSRYIAEAVQARLRRDRMKEAWEESFGVLDAAAYPDWSSSARVVDWVRDRRAEQTNAGDEG
jgi:metal-responsive CopG/Arc/MetJ family transcriptional regulator